MADGGHWYQTAKRAQDMAGSTIPRGFRQAEPQDVLERLIQSERLLTAKELAVLLAVSPKTLYSYVSRNMIPVWSGISICLNLMMDAK